jgi:hypothetical protein
MKNLLNKNLQKTHKENIKSFGGFAVFLFAFFINISFVKAQNGGELDKAKHLTIEEILMKQDPNKAKTLFNKDQYLVVENMRNGKRKRYYMGDVFRCKTKDGFIYEEEIHYISDSSFVMAAYNEVMSKFEYREIKINEVERIYNRPTKNKFKLGLNAAPLAYLLFDWAAYGIEPHKNPSLGVMAMLEAGTLIIQNIGRVFKSRKITENYRLRIFRAY